MYDCFDCFSDSRVSVVIIDSRLFNSHMFDCFFSNLSTNCWFESFFSWHICVPFVPTRIVLSELIYQTKVLIRAIRFNCHCIIQDLCFRMKVILFTVDLGCHFNRKEPMWREFPCNSTSKICNANMNGFAIADDMVRKNFGQRTSIPCSL